MDDCKTLELAFAHGAATAPAHETPDGGKLVLVPDGYKTVTVAPLEPALPRIRQAVVVHDVASFVAYVERYKTEATRLFAEPGFLASPAWAHVTAVMDYHLPGVADRGVHTVDYVPRYSEQWLRWMKACQEPIGQAAFAELIEEARGDITDPEAAKLMDIVRTFKASKKVEFDSVVYQPNGDVTLGYDEKTQQRGSSGVLPEKMHLGMPVYFRGDAYVVDVFIRFRVEAGAVKFQLKIDRADIIEDAAFSDVAKRIGEVVGIEPYLGRR